MARKLDLTPTAIDGLKSGSLNDPRTDGLSITRTGAGKLVWKYTRKIAGAGGAMHKATGGRYPGTTIAAARTWAAGLNTMIEAGTDPREVERQEATRLANEHRIEAARIEREAAVKAMTLDAAHALYMEAVEANTHKTRRTKSARPIKERTKDDKRGLYDRHVSPRLGDKPIIDVTQADLVTLIIDLGKRTSKGVQANRTGAELRVFFSWCCSLKGQAAGIVVDKNPTTVLGELWNPQTLRDRWLDHDELPLFLKAVAHEDELHRRGLLLLLLTGCRFSEVMAAPMSEWRSPVWYIPGARTKNGLDHPITMGPWGASLMDAGGSEFLIQSPARLTPQAMTAGWPKIIARVRERMEKISGKTVEHFTPHDLRRTMRSHIDDLGIDEVTCERMINHAPAGLIKIYNRNRRAKALEAGFLAWEEAVVTMARDAGVADALGITKAVDSESKPLPLAA